MSRTQRSVQHSNMEASIEASKKGSLPSPRSTHSHFSKLQKQKEKIEEMKQEAMLKLEGLSSFEFMILSKQKFSEADTDEDLRQKFESLFGINLPLKHIDMVLVQGLSAGEGALD